jgi:predicted DCC family thiol-disulfide oxidoreductase YuxK
MTAAELQRRLGVPGADMVIIYDGQCIFCSAYVKLLRLRDAVGQIQFLNARMDGLADLAARELSLDLNKGMLVIYGGQYHHGPEAMTILSLLTHRSGMLNRTIAAVFRSRVASRLLYPALRLGRALALRALGRSAIRSSGYAFGDSEKRIDRGEALPDPTRTK